MTINEQIAILQAFKEGKSIRYISNEGVVLSSLVIKKDKDIKDHIFDFKNNRYEIVEPEKTLEENIFDLAKSYSNEGEAFIIMNDIFSLADKRYQRKDN